MQNPFVPFSGMYQTQLEASRRFAAALFAGTERIDHVLLDATHNVLSDQLNLVQSMAGLQDSQEGAASLLPKRPEWMLDCQRELISIFSDIQEELNQSMRQYIDEVSQSALAAASAQEESRAVDANTFNPVTGMFSVWENAFREATSLAGRNMEAAGNSFRDNSDAANAAYASAEEDIEQATGKAAGSHRARKSTSHARHASHGKRSR